MSELTFKSNRHMRDTIDIVFDDIDGWHQCRDDAELERSETGFIYRGSVYALSEFTVAGDDLRGNGWDGVQAEGYFSAVVVKCWDEFGRNLDGVIVGYVHW